MKKVFLAQIVPAEVERYIEAHCEVRKWDREERISREALLEAVSDVDGLLLSGMPIDRELLDRAPKLKVVSNVSVGYNNFDLVAMKERGVIGTHTPGVLDETVADLVFALILAAARRVPELDRLVKEGRWAKGNDRPLFGTDVHHAKLGIVGMGRIGEAVARRAKLGFLMDVAYYNRSRKPETEARLGVAYAPLDTLLAESDFVVLMLPLTDATRRFIDREKLALMKPSAYLINASRGQTVDEAALVEALAAGRLRGAALDVYDEEPVPKHHPLLQLPNVVTLPHIGSATEKTRFDMALLAAQNLVKAVTGMTPPNIVPELRPGE
ncbi:D-glycerate dehydrogenase [Paenibacillus sp.]|uniref:2-hydroxyacid dehydrogenase n=1 Tax=Paenibacillus sp. TaxID=58172 RepID=UPI002D3F60EC|nr:D-glycerate dehydrogenase [Paenibacillus sp.]HZG56079.1 D-glycerate dehydrogenase [Paenibacillus sp.]